MLLRGCGKPTSQLMALGLACVSFLCPGSVVHTWGLGGEESFLTRLLAAPTEAERRLFKGTWYYHSLWFSSGTGNPRHLLGTGLRAT